MAQKEAAPAPEKKEAPPAAAPAEESGERKPMPAALMTKTGANLESTMTEAQLQKMQ